jgi:hypothetical protein
MEHACGVALQQALFECAMKKPQSALLHFRVMNVERLKPNGLRLALGRTTRRSGIAAGGTPRLG